MAQIELLAGEKCDNESNSAVLACNDWLRLGPGRSIPKLLDSYEQKSTTINNFSAPSTSYATLRAWSSRYGWPDRATGFDAGYEDRVNQEREAEINYGLALDYERIRKLKRMAALLEDQLFERGPDGSLINLWVADVKQIGSGKDAEQVDIERFNSALLREYREVLNDLAKEVGGRVVRQQNELGGSIKVTHELSDDDMRQAILSKLSRIADTNESGAIPDEPNG